MALGLEGRRSTRGESRRVVKREGSRRGARQARAALTRKKKEEKVEALRKQIDGKTMLARFGYEGFTNKELEGVRGSLPSDADVVVVKNALLSIAVEGTEFEGIENGIAHDNALLIAGDDAPQAVKKLNQALKQKQKQGWKNIGFNRGVMQGQPLDAEEVSQIENLPSREQLMGKVAGAVKAVPSKLAVGIKMVPTKLAYGSKEISDGKSELISQ